MISVRGHRDAARHRCEHLTGQIFIRPHQSMGGRKADTRKWFLMRTALRMPTMKRYRWPRSTEADTSIRQ